MGGPSSEHEVSLMSGESVLRELINQGYEALPVLISRNGGWPLHPEELRDKADLAFIAMHGDYGEDGQVQNILEDYEIPYTGSDPLSSALGMNKIFTHQIFRANNLHTPEFMVVNKNDSVTSSHFDFGDPLVVKPVDRGSSLGVSIVRNENELLPALKKSFGLSRDALIEKYIPGQEITCAVIEDENGDLVTLQPLEIIPKASHFFDYVSKYTEGGAEEIPARLPDYKISLIEEIAKTAHRSIGARDLSRTDMVVSPDERVYVLEINTIPGMTPYSLVPKAGGYSGFGFGWVLERIINSAGRRYGLL